MIWQKLLIISGAVTGCLLALAIGGFGGVEFFDKFLSRPDVDSVGPGDGTGLILCAILFAIPLTVANLLGWKQLYRKLSNGTATRAA